MTVEELIEALMGYPKDTHVWTLNEWGVMVNNIEIEKITDEDLWIRGEHK